MPRKFHKHAWLIRNSCIADLKPLCEKLNIGADITKNGAAYKVSGFRLENWKFMPVFSEFRVDRHPKISDLVGAITHALKTPEGQASFCHGYLFANINRLYAGAGLEGRPFVPGQKQMETIGQRMGQTRVTYNPLIPLHGITRPTKNGFHIWLRSWHVLGHELMHAASGLDFFPGNEAAGKVKTVLYRVVGYLEGVMRTTPIGRYYGSRIWALNHNNHSAVLEETIASALDDEKDRDFEGLWGSVKSALLQMPEDERKRMMDSLMLAWFNFSGAQANKECEEFVLGAIRSNGKG